jgi:hypothetical protein
MLTSRFFMSTDVIAHILRLLGPKMVMALCNHGSKSGPFYIDVASHTYIQQPLTRILLLLYASMLLQSNLYCAIRQLSLPSELRLI